MGGAKNFTSTMTITNGVAGRLTLSDPSTATNTAVYTSTGITIKGWAYNPMIITNITASTVATSVSYSSGTGVALLSGTTYMIDSYLLWQSTNNQCGLACMLSYGGTALYSNFEVAIASNPGSPETQLLQNYVNVTAGSYTSSVGYGGGTSYNSKNMYCKVSGMICPTSSATLYPVIKARAGNMTTTLVGGVIRCYPMQ